MIEQALKPNSYVAVEERVEENLSQAADDQSIESVAVHLVQSISSLRVQAHRDEETRLVPHLPCPWQPLSI
jgi:hypothetical protein